MKLSETTNPARYQQADWMALHTELERYAIDKHCFYSAAGDVYRKGWEWTHCLYGLQQLGMLTPEARGCGIGAGREPVIFYLADRISEVVATDLYDNEEWSSGNGMEASRHMIEEAKRACPVSVDFSRVRFENQDGLSLTYPDDEFDFAWSLSSIEHFGGHAGALVALREMARIVKPGGIVAVATELLLLDEHHHYEYFTRSALIHGLIGGCDELSLVDDVNFDTLTPEYLIDSVLIPQGASRTRRHVVLNDGAVQWTSVLVFLRKKSGAST